MERIEKWERKPAPLKTTRGAAPELQIRSKRGPPAEGYKFFDPCFKLMRVFFVQIKWVANSLAFFC
jgi:hypothetical protein